MVAIPLVGPVFGAAKVQRQCDVHAWRAEKVTRLETF